MPKKQAEISLVLYPQKQNKGHGKSHIIGKCALEHLCRWAHLIFQGWSVGVTGNSNSRCGHGCSEEGVEPRGAVVFQGVGDAVRGRWHNSLLLAVSNGECSSCPCTLWECCEEWESST